MYDNINFSKTLCEIDLTKCRLCQENDGSIEFLTNSILFEQITFCTRINMEDNDENEQLPKFICENCNQLLNNFFLFQENCLKVDEQLKKLLNKNVKRKIVRRTVKSNILNRRKSILKSFCKKCGDPTKSNRHCCKVEETDEPKEEEIDSENIIVKIEPERVTETTKDDVLYLTLIAEENIIKNEVTLVDETQIELIDEKPVENIEENEDDFKVEVLEDEFSNHLDETDDNSEDDFQQRIKKVRKTKDSTEIENFICSFNDCGKIYATKGGLKKHYHSQHNIRDFLCTICGKNFRRYSGLKAHERIHLSIKSYTCPKCNRGFVQAANLRTHIKLHHEGHRYYCTKCGRGFLTSCTLKRHELIHIGKKDFKCDICPSEFYTRRELIKHKKYHYDIRSHFCNICYKSFVEKHHLTIHMRSHTGERPYSCDVSGCGKSFMESQKLRRHKKNVHRLKV